MSTQDNDTRTFDEILVDTQEKAKTLRNIYKTAKEDGEKEEREFYEKEAKRGRGRPRKESSEKAKPTQVFLTPEQRKTLMDRHQGKTIGRILKWLALKEIARIEDEEDE